MLRGEKRALPPDSSPGMAGTGAGVVAATAPGAATSPHPHKKAKEKMPDFDWSADNYALTWRLVEELRKPENKNVLFPDHENMAVKSGDTKEDVYRRIAKVVHPEAYAQDPQIAGSRMKNKNVAMWKEYSGYCRRLQELCATHRVVIPAAGPDEGFPHEILAEWRKILISMPAFQALRSFMPVRPEEKPKTPTVKVQRGVSSIPQAPPEEEHAVEHLHNGVNSVSSFGPVQSPSPSVKRGSESLAGGTAEGQKVTVNGSDAHIQSSTKLSLADYLELRRSYHEDVRLGIFSPSEIKIRIENLDKQRTQADSSRLMMPPPSSAASTTSTYSQSMTPQFQPRVVTPDPMQEQVYEEKAMLLGFRKPSHPNPLSRLTNKEFFKAILDHAAECDMQECRLDNRRMTPQLSFVPSHHPHEAQVHFDIALMTRTGPVPLANHPLAASIRCLVRNPIHVFDIPLVIHNVPPSWDTTPSEYALAVSTAALSRRLTIEEIKSVQSHPHLVTVDHATRRQYQLLNEASTVFDVLRLGWLTPNGWTPVNQVDEPMDHPVTQQH